MSLPPFEFNGDPALRETVTHALQRVIDPEMALDIVSLGLVYGVDVEEKRVRARITMTSPACPVRELIIAQARGALDAAFGEDVDVQVEVGWDPPWSPERMSDSARRAMDW